MFTTDSMKDHIFSSLGWDEAGRILGIQDPERYFGEASSEDLKTAFTRLLARNNP
jgi:hypothetical protein